MEWEDSSLPKGIDLQFTKNKIMFIVLLGVGITNFLFEASFFPSFESESVSHSVVLTLWTHNSPGFSVHGILQARILEWVAIPFSRGSSLPRNGTQVSCTADRFFTTWATWEAHVLLRSNWHMALCKLKVYSTRFDLHTSWNGDHNKFSEHPLPHVDTELSKAKKESLFSMRTQNLLS